MSKTKLIQEIIARSEGITWEKAKVEWDLHEVYESDEPCTCLCGHFPIIEICTLLNRINGITVDVGNCCVKNFIGLPSDKIFAAVKRVRKNPAKSLNVESITHGYRKGWINDWERDFYLNIMNKRNLSTSQDLKKRQIDNKFMARMRQNSRADGLAR